jgi:hypothetical protein
MKKNRSHDSLISHKKPDLDLVSGDYFWSCHNALKTILEYGVIDDDLFYNLHILVIQNYGDHSPNLIPGKKRQVIGKGYGILGD